MAGELADAEVDEGEDHHREDHQRRDCDKDDRLVPDHWRWIVDRIVSDHPPCQDQYTPEGAENDLGEDGSARLGRERQSDDRNEGVAEPDGDDAGGRVAVRGLPGNCARPDREEGGEDEVVDLERTGRLPEGFDQLVQTFLF